VVLKGQVRDMFFHQLVLPSIRNDKLDIFVVSYYNFAHKECTLCCNNSHICLTCSSRFAWLLFTLIHYILDHNAHSFSIHKAKTKSPRIRSQIRNGSKGSVRDSLGTDFCKNPRNPPYCHVPLNAIRFVLRIMEAQH
jgi:hypothetical protein